MPKTRLRDQLTKLNQLLSTATVSSEGSRDCCSEYALTSWFDPLELTLDTDLGLLTVQMPHVFFGQRFQQHFQTVFEREARNIWGRRVRFQYLTSCSTPDRQLSASSLLRTRLSHQGSAETHPLSASSKAQEDAGITACPVWTFETFLRTGKQHWGWELAQHFANTQHPSILVLCGAHGTGKSHLAHAITHVLHTKGLPVWLHALAMGETRREESPEGLGASALNTEAKALPTSFLNRGHLREHLYSHQVLILDNMHLLAHPTTLEEAALFQQELAECLTTDPSKVVCLAGTGHPATWGLTPRLYRLLEQGQWAELPEPDHTLRRHYAKQQMKRYKIRLSQASLNVMIQHCRTLPHLDRALQHLLTQQTVFGNPCTEQDVLDAVEHQQHEPRLTAQDIMLTVGDYYGISPKTMLEETRKPAIVQARQLAMYLCRELIGLSYPKLGRLFGGKDHATILYSVRKIQQKQEDDRLVHTMVTEVTKSCLERHNRAQSP